MKYIGKIDKRKLGRYANEIVTEDVVLTDERIEHIQLRHSGDYEKYKEYISIIIKEPDYILDDKNNKDTILLLKEIKEKNIQLVIKLQTNYQEKNKSNSILTFWHIRNRNYRSTIKNNEIIYKS